MQGEALQGGRDTLFSCLRLGPLLLHLPEALHLVHLFRLRLSIMMLLQHVLPQYGRV